MNFLHSSHLTDTFVEHTSYLFSKLWSFATELVSQSAQVFKAQVTLISEVESSMRPPFSLSSPRACIFYITAQKKVDIFLLPLP